MRDKEPYGQPLVADDDRGGLLSDRYGRSVVDGFAPGADVGPGEIAGGDDVVGQVAYTPDAFQPTTGLSVAGNEGFVGRMTPAQARSIALMRRLYRAGRRGGGALPWR